MGLAAEPPASGPHAVHVPGGRAVDRPVQGSRPLDRARRDLPAEVAEPHDLSPQPVRAGPLNVAITFSEDGRDFLRRDWSDLVDADPAATFFHTPRYLKLYWEEFGQDAGLLLAFAEDDDRCVGAVAFERLGRTLRFLGGTEVTDYMGPVAAPGTEDRVAKELVHAVASRRDWDDADLRGL